MPNPSTVCQQCGRAGHAARDCRVGRVAGRVPPVLRGTPAKVCFTCGKPGHVARDFRSGGCGQRVQQQQPQPQRQPPRPPTATTRSM
eukprot:4237137-Heterocapsa_arctica.AAC.1